jgi:hypothetical protein
VTRAPAGAPAAPKKIRIPALEVRQGPSRISLGFVMDAIADARLDDHDEIDLEDFVVQNTPRDIQLVTNYLLGEYRAGPDGRGPRQLRLIKVVVDLAIVDRV